MDDLRDMEEAKLRNLTALTKELAEALDNVAAVICLDTDEDNVGELAHILGIEDIETVSGMCWRVRAALQKYKEQQP